MNKRVLFFLLGCLNIYIYLFIDYLPGYLDYFSNRFLNVFLIVNLFLNKDVDIYTMVIFIFLSTIMYNNIFLSIIICFVIESLVFLVKRCLRINFYLMIIFGIIIVFINEFFLFLIFRLFIYHSFSRLINLFRYLLFSSVICFVIVYFILCKKRNKKGCGIIKING